MISVCMATYNGERFIKEQLLSILSQISLTDEIIVSDDGSSDKTLKIIEEIEDSRIKLYHHKKEEENGVYKNFRYATSNFENALTKAKGDYIFLSDQDDIWEQNKLQKCLELLKKYDCIVHNYSVINEKGELLKFQQFKKKPIHKSIFMNILDNHFRGCCMAFNRKILNMILPFPRRIIGHDYWIGILASHYTSVYYEIEPLLKSRWYNESVSARKKTNISYKLQFRIDLLIETIKKIILRKGEKIDTITK